MSLYKFPIRLVFILLFLLPVYSVSAQYTSTDFTRAERFVWDSISPKVYFLSVNPQWFEDGSGFAFKTNTKEGEKHFTYSISTKKRSEAFDNEFILDGIQKITDKTPKLSELSQFKWTNKNSFTFQFNGEEFKADLTRKTIQKTKKKEVKDKNSSLSPDGKKEAFISDDNLYVKDLESGSVTPLSTNGSDLYKYGSTYGWDQLMKGEGTPPDARLNVAWSPDSKKILTQIMNARNAQKMYLLNHSIDSLYRPELLSYFRGSPGDKDVVVYHPVIYDVNTQNIVRLQMPPVPHFMDDLAGYGLKWSKDGKRIYGTYNHRGYKQKDIIEIDPLTGKIHVHFSDISDTNIDYLTRFNYMDELNSAFYTSEKTGWKQLYLLDFNSDKMTAVTQGEYVVKHISAIDIKNKVVYFTASGKEKDVNPYFDLLYKVNFDGSGLTLLTPEPLNHEVSISPDFKYIVDNMSSAESPGVSVLRNTKNGKVLGEISRTDISELTAMGWKPPQLYTATAQDGKTTLYGALWKPTDFDASKKYPIVDYTYTGPHMNVYPNTFRKGLYGLYNSAQSLAELGFIVMQVDGMGTAGRSKAFHNVSYKNMGNNLLDHTLAIKDLAAKYSWIDGERVGIYGHSAGGYDATHALLAFNDTYKTAISSAADHDWRMEKAWWPEMYAGWPVDEVYHDQSNVTMAGELKGSLLLIHGGIDENVNPSATFKMAENLIKNGIYFDMLIIPSARHRYPNEYQPYVMKKRWMFFIENLRDN